MARCLCSFILLVLCSVMSVWAQPETNTLRGFRMASEAALADHGGIPFPVDLDGDGAVDVLWLQSPGLFHSAVFDKPPWKGRFSAEERQHFCLTATNAKGRVRWQVGTPWGGDRPFVTHSAERSVDWADLDGDGELEVVYVSGSTLVVLAAKTGKVKASVKTPADNAQIVRVAHTGRGVSDWTILVKNAESAYAPHEYANPAWFYDANLQLIKTADYLGAGHTPLVADVDGDGFDEFFIGFNLVDHDLTTVWTYKPAAPEAWDAGEMHADDLVLGELNGRVCIVAAASDTSHVLDALTGDLLWKRAGTHPQHAQIGHFSRTLDGNQIFVHNKRAELQLFNPEGAEIWNMMPPPCFPLGVASACAKQQFHVFDPTTVLPGMGQGGTDQLIFTDRGWPYVISGDGKRSLELPYTENAAQDWGDVPGRPDDYGYGYYTRVADFDGDKAPEVLVNDRRYAWVYELDTSPPPAAVPRSDARVLHADFEGYRDGIVQALNAGVRWLGDPFAKRNEGLVEITQVGGVAGPRAAHVATVDEDQIGRVRLQPRYDAPKVAGDVVVEFMFCPTQDDAADLEDLMVWSAEAANGKRSGVRLLANGDAESGRYRLDVLHGGPQNARQPARTDFVVHGLNQADWHHIIMHQTGARVGLWIGSPGNEVFCGSFPPLSEASDIATVEIGDPSLKHTRGSGYWDDIRVGGVLGEGAEVAAPEPPLRDVSQERAVISYPIAVGSQKQLFVDDALVESMQGVTRTLHPVTKHPGNPLMVPERPWEGQSILLYGSVIPDPDTGKLRMWYLAWGKHIGKPSFICYAESDDGLKWVKPDLGLFEHEGSKKNNIVMPGWSENTVIYDPHDTDPSRRYKAVLRMSGTRGFLSPDGLRWRDVGVLLEQAYDSTTVHWDPIGKKWIAMVKIFCDGERARGYAESTDFLNWTDTYFMYAADENDAPGDQMYSNYLFCYEGIYFGLLRMYTTSNDKVEVQLMTSRNAKHWNRSLRKPFIPTSPERETWDYGNNSVPSTPPIRRGDELWFYYSGRSTLHDEVPNTGAIGLATLRLDGFFSMDAGKKAGVLTTRTLTLEGDELFLNTNASGGTVRVEILDESGTPLPAYTAARCKAIVSDKVRLPVAWEGGKNLSALAGKTVRLRFQLESAELYAFWTE